MVCHATYKDEKNNWCFPDQVETEDGVNYFLKNYPNKKIKVGSSESMSKSKKNTIDPQKIIDDYGADAVRLFILSDSPPEKDVQWSDRGMEAAYKFILKLWTLHQNILKKDTTKENKENDQIINIFTNNTIEKITKNLENFNYNVIIANLYEIYNFFNEKIRLDLNYKNLISNYIQILKVMIPIIPHFSYECLSQLKYEEKIMWPKTDSKFLEKKEFKIVIQINGKKKELISINKEMSEEDLIKTIKQNEKISKLLSNSKIKKTIYVKNRLINLII